MSVAKRADFSVLTIFIWYERKMPEPVNELLREAISSRKFFKESPWS